MENLTATQIEHKKLGVKATLHDFSQKQFEQYHELLFVANVHTVAAKNGIVLVCAIKAGILTGINAEEVPNMRPAAVTWLQKQVHQHILDITNPPADDPN